MLLIIVHRLLQSFIFPPLNAMLIILLGILLLRFHKKIAITLLVSGLLFLYIQSTPFIAAYITRSIEQAPLDETKLKAAQAIVILGGGVNGNSYEYQQGVSAKVSTLIRLDYAAYLAKKYPQKLIITSGGYTGTNREARVMKSALINDFEVKNPIILEDNSRNTDENAEFVAKLLKPLHINNIILVTQASHMKRAMMLFKKYNLNPIGASTDYYDNYDAKTPALTLIPNASAMNQVSLIGHEYLGYLIYN